MANILLSIFSFDFISLGGKKCENKTFSSTFHSERLKKPLTFYPGLTSFHSSRDIIKRANDKEKFSFLHSSVFMFSEWQQIFCQKHVLNQLTSALKCLRVSSVLCSSHYAARNMCQWAIAWSSRNVNEIPHSFTHA